VGEKDKRRKGRGGEKRVEKSRGGKGIERRRGEQPERSHSSKFATTRPLSMLSRMLLVV